MPKYSPEERIAARVIASLIYPDYPDGPDLDTDAAQLGLYKAAVDTCRDPYAMAAITMPIDGILRDCHGDAATAWEGLRQMTGAATPYARIDPLIRDIGGGFELPELYAPVPAPAKNGDSAVPSKQVTEYASVPSMPIDSNDLLALERRPVKWFAPSFLREGLGLLVGLPQVGKTPLAIQLGIAIATGAKWMGRVQCRRAKVLYLGVEYTRQELIPLLDISRCGVVIPRDMLIFKTMEDEFPRDPDAALADLEWYIRVLEVEVIIIDVLTAFLPPEKFKQNIYRGDYTELKPYHRLASLHHTAILGTWHGSKREVDPRLMYNGSVGLWAVPASRMSLYTDTESRVRFSSFPRLHERLDWALAQEKTNNGHRWIVSDAAPEPMCSPTELQVYRCLKQHAEKTRPLGPNTIAELTSIPISTIKSCLQRMFSSNIIHQPPKGGGYFIEVASDASLASAASITSDASISTQEMDANNTASQSSKTNGMQRMHDSPDATIWGTIPPSKGTTLRVYLQSNKDSDQERAQEICDEYGIDYKTVYTLVQRGSA